MKSVNSSTRLMTVVDQILDQHPAGISEYDLMVELDQNYGELYPKPDLGQPLLLFQHHFFLRHTLYQLQSIHTESGKFSIKIDAVTIQKTLNHSSNDTLPDNHDPLRDYYLNLVNLNREDNQSIHTMLTNFWQALARYQHQPEALTVLGLTGSENKKEKQARYRQLVQQHHPDKGGDPEQFRRIQNAWQSIKKMR